MLRYFPEYEPQADVIWSQAYETAKSRAEQKQPPPPERPMTTMQGVVAEFLKRGGSWTQVQIAHHTGVNWHSVRFIIFALKQRGHVVVSHKRSGPHGHSYSWVSR